MKLILIRHGEAERLTAQDTERVLTDRGLRQASWTMQEIARRFHPDAFIVSPLRRAQQTLAPLQQQFPQVPVQVCDLIKPDDPAAPALKWLSQQTGECIVVVCHMNVIALLAAQLLAESPVAFDLAEAWVLDQVCIGPGQSTRVLALQPPSDI